MSVSSCRPFISCKRLRNELALKIASMYIPKHNWRRSANLILTRNTSKHDQVSSKELQRVQVSRFGVVTLELNFWPDIPVQIKHIEVIVQRLVLIIWVERKTSKKNVLVLVRDFSYDCSSSGRRDRARGLEGCPHGSRKVWAFVFKFYLAEVE